MTKEKVPSIETIKFKNRQRKEAAKRVATEKRKEVRLAKKKAAEKAYQESRTATPAENCSIDAVNQPTV
jgi:hypothetical protein